MIEPFCSVYTKSYRVHDREPETEGTKPCLYFKDLGENFLPAEDSKAIYNPERDETVIKELYLKRLESIYQKSYCSTEGKKSMVIDPNDLDADQFMVYFNNYYKKRTQAIPRPLDTARRVFGYTRFDYYYTGKTLYQDTISRVGYDYFKRDYDRGKSRLYGKKQQAMSRSKESEKNEEVEVRAPPTPQKSETEKVKEKICAFCCEKYGEFSCFPDRNSNEETAAE